MLDTPKHRSNSTTSMASASSGASTYSRSAEDMFERLLEQKANTEVHLWSAGCIRVDGLDLAMPMADARELLGALRSDERFELIDIVYLGGDEDEWKASYRRGVATVSQ